MLVFVQRALCLKFLKGEGVAGYFADLGDLYNTYHLWGKFLGIKWKSSPNFFYNTKLFQSKMVLGRSS